MAEIEDTYFDRYFDNEPYDGPLTVISEEEHKERVAEWKKVENYRKKLKESASMLEEIIIFPGDEKLFARTYGYDTKKIEVIDRKYKNKGLEIGIGDIWRDGQYDCSKGMMILNPTEAHLKDRQRELIEMTHKGIIALVYSTKTESGWYGLPIRLKNE